MHSVPMKKVVVAGTLAVAAGALLLANVVPSSFSAPRASGLASEATISPLAMMMRAPRDLPVERYDSH